jgi:hypothetical protein
MNIHRVERAVVEAVGFLLGAALAVCIAPGDVLLWVLAGLVLAVFCREHFVRNCGDDFVWWFAHHPEAPPKPPASQSP